VTRAVTDAYRLGRVDGLREAVTILREMGGAIDAKRPSPARVTRDSRRVRRQAYRNAEVRLTTALRRRLPRRSPDQGMDQ